MGDVRNFIQVSEVMTRRPVVIASGKNVVEAADLMRRHSIGSLLVLNDKKLEGIFTLDDIVYKAVADGKCCSDLKVEDIMSKTIISVNPTDDVSDAMELMNENNIKQLPVISDGELVGFLTVKDILRIEPAMIDLTIEQLRLQEEHRQRHIQKIVEKDGLDIDEDLFE
ncbi:CBS domain-containing protein [Candidatus Woesearchaeota archaeon]|nr:CBS domain-containing protein [Candidatus Woesearchaeota archaeon]